MRRLTLIIGSAWVVLAVYVISYAAQRGSHRLVHSALWISEEGLNGHHVHAIICTDEALLGAFRPLVWLETAGHDIVE